MAYSRQSSGTLNGVYFVNTLCAHHGAHTMKINESVLHAIWVCYLCVFVYTFVVTFAVAT